LETLLDRSQSRRPLCRRGLLAAALLAFAIVLPVAGVGFHTVRAATAFVEPAVDPDAKPPQQESTDPIKRLTEIQKKIREHYVGPIDQQRLGEEALRGVPKSLKDPYTHYSPAED